MQTQCPKRSGVTMSGKQSFSLSAMAAAVAAVSSSATDDELAALSIVDTAFASAVPDLTPEDAQALFTYKVPVVGLGGGCACVLHCR